MSNLNKQTTALEPGAKIYLMGICGTGMAALAGLLKEKGYVVVGSDSGCYPPMDSVIRDLNIPVHIGYDSDNVKKESPDLVIIGNVIRKDNPEAIYVLDSGIDYMSFPQALGEFFLSERKPLVVTGTHGKTTTCTLLVAALKAFGQSPGFMIGGVPLDESRGFSAGQSQWFVVEGDEYDTSFFQKVSKFLFYKPFGAIITSIEFDHADIFSNLDEIKKSFKKFVGLVPKDGIIAACTDWESVKEVISEAQSKVVTFGFNEDAHWRPEQIKFSTDATYFTALGPGGEQIEASTTLPGRHNVINALGVIALCSNIGLELNTVLQGIKNCKGVKRRQEVRGEINGIMVIDDFAHHPRAVKETLEALKARYKDRRLIAVFEPRTNTSRQAIFQEYYSEAFHNADLVLVRDVPEPEKFPENNRFSSQQLVSDLNHWGVKAHFFKNAAEIIEYVKKHAQPGDIYAVLSNGPFENIHQGLLDAIKDKK